MNIQHDRTAHRFSTELEGQTGRLDYEIDGSVMRITHTKVPKPIGGRGVAAELMRAALEFAADQRLEVTPVCAYAIAYMKRHPTSHTDAHEEMLLDEALAESFPASDPPAVGHIS